MNNHIPFPSIGQFKDAIKHIRQSAKWAGVTVPTVTFLGTTKCHGSNAGICRKFYGTVDDIYFQSRERVITPLDDNAGFAMWAYSNRDKFSELFDTIAKNLKCTDDSIIQIFGEWAGGNIQKGVGLNKIEKSMFVFGIRVSVDAASTKWEDEYDVHKWVTDNKFDRFYSIYEFPTWTIEIDMNKPELSQNRLVELTNLVEADCPVARQLVGESDDELIGEGIVWTAISSDVPEIDVSGLRMKVKGERHSASKVKTVAAVDVEKVNSINEFVEKTVTINRLNQGLDKLREMGLEATTESTGAFIKWVMGDVLKEEIDVLAASGLTTKEVYGRMATTAREFYLKALDA